MSRRVSLALEKAMEKEKKKLLAPPNADKGRTTARRSTIFSESLLLDTKPPPKKADNIGSYIPSVLCIGAVLITYRFLGGHQLFNLVNPKHLQTQYDYIIVGAGTSGSVLADRITDGSMDTALVIEAGGDPSEKPEIDIPILAEDAWGSEFDWNYMTVPQKFACKLHEGNQAKWPSGKGWGGTSLLNYMIYLRGSRHDYDEWAQNGAQGWAYKDVLPYFIKSEDNHNGGFVNTVFHGYGGRMTVTDADMTPVHKIMTKAFEEVGVKKKDIHGKSQYGYSQIQATVRNGIRWSTYQAFLKRAEAKDHVYLLANTPVQKVIFEGKKAVGVLITHNGKQKIIKAKKEVILAAGTVGSAKLLMLSGVGPRRHLEQHNIPVVADLPVGDNLQDHVTADGIEFFSPHYMSTSVARADGLGTAWSYSLFGKGMKASPRFREGIAFVRTRYQPSHVKYPMISLTIASSIGTYIPSHLNVNPKTWKLLHGSPPSRDGLTIFPTLLHPRSRGSVRLQSSNHEDPPLINPNYLQEDADVKILVEAYQYVRRLLRTSAMKDWDMTLAPKLLPECSDHGNFTDDYVECLIRHITIPGFAPVGTCKIGSAGDPTAVVDPNLKVRGLKNIRVVDASVFPNAISGNTYAPQVMLAEKASDMIKGVNSVKAIQDYFKHLIATRHDKFKEEEVQNAASTNIEDRK